MNIAEASFPRHLLGIGLALFLPRLCGAMTTEHLPNMTNVLIVGVVVLMILPKILGFGVSVKV